MSVDNWDSIFNIIWGLIAIAVILYLLSLK